LLGSESPVAFVGYLFNHAGLAHLMGNMVFLWVFGNAVCATIGNLAYPFVYLGLGAFAGLIHLLITGTPVVGASGAIAGVVGLAVAFYPVNRVNLLLLLGFMTRTIRVRLWGLALYWTAWDVFGAWLQQDNVAYWAHLGGTAAGLAVGLALLAFGRVRLTEFDHGSLLDFLRRRKPPHQIPPGKDVTFAQMQAAARAFRASLAAEAKAAEETERQPQPPISLQLGAKSAARPANAQTSLSSGSSSLPAAVVAKPSIQLNGGRPLAAVPPNASPSATTRAAQPANTWLTSLPEGRYFYFDGHVRRGPIARADFLGRLSFAPNTTRWWFWVAGMKDWQRVSDLNNGAAASRSAPTVFPDSSAT
jgi:membrane associated rhomboid family serine protease